MTVVQHFIAHTRNGWRAVAEPESAQWLWAHLRAWSPGALALTLMPDHLHLARRGGDRDELVRILAGHTRRFGVRWDVSEPTPCRSTEIILRTIRYIYLNPVRAKLVDDVLAWTWSTARDLVGAVYEPWTPLDRIARELGMSPHEVTRVLIDDPPVRPNGPLVASPIAVASATASALRGHPRDLHRRQGPARAVFVDLAYRHGAPAPEHLAPLCRVTPRSIRRLRGMAPRAAVTAASACLHDPRLRTWRVPPA